MTTTFSNLASVNSGLLSEMELLELEKSEFKNREKFNGIFDTFPLSEKFDPVKIFQVLIAEHASNS